MTVTPAPPLSALSFLAALYLCVLALGVGLGLGLTTKPPHEARASLEGRRCVIVDNDFDIDDMMSIPLALGNSHVAAIVQTEEVSLPGQAAPVVDYAFNHVTSRGRGLKVPVIVGGLRHRAPTYVAGRGSHSCAR